MLQETFREPGIVAFENESNGDATDGKNQDFVASYQVSSIPFSGGFVFQSDHVFHILRRDGRWSQACSKYVQSWHSQSMI